MATLPNLVEPKSCTICGETAKPFGVVDFNRHCSEDRIGRLPQSGIPIAYSRCEGCGFVFTAAFDDWLPEDFAARIYNADYVAVDPDYADLRPRGNASSVVRLFGAHRAELSCLDYGGGSGLLADLLRKAGFKRAESFDEFNPAHAVLPEGPFDLVTCFEVFEHVVDPHRLMSSLSDLIGERSLLYFSTLLQPRNIEQLGLSWWYIGPRNGHVSIYSRSALNLLLIQYELEWASMNNNLHFAWRRRPAFAADLLGRLGVGAA